MSPSKYNQRKTEIANLMRLSKRKNCSGEAKRMGRIIIQIAKELKVRPEQVLPETVMALRCCDSRMPKVKFRNLKELRTAVGYGHGNAIYVCHDADCLHYHVSTTVLVEPKTYVCLGCNLPYLFRGKEVKYCCKGCKKRHKNEQRRQDQANQKSLNLN